MTFTDFVRKRGGQFTVKSLASLFVDEYLLAEFEKVYGFIKPKDYDGIEALRISAKADYDDAGDQPTRLLVLKAFLKSLDEFAVDLAARIDRRRLKSKTEKEGRIVMANAVSPVVAREQIQGDRVLHYTSAFDAIVESNKLRISKSSDQGCLFCVPARYADQLAGDPPTMIKQCFDIRQDVDYYVEFNLENSRGFESYNSHIDAKLKGQKELKIHTEILDLDRRNPQWYRWLGSARGGWVLVAGPYAWGTKK